MKIAFDLDDTLLPHMQDFTTEASAIPLASRCLPIWRLRLGTRQLILELQDQGHEVWIYTRSQRSQSMIFWMFLLNGMRLQGIVNDRRHHLAIKTQPRELQLCFKLPPMFGIDILFDDAAYVRDAGITADFRVVQVNPHNPQWSSQVKESIEELKAAKTLEATPAARAPR